MIFEAALPDIPRLYTALAEWMACLICIYPIITMQSLQSTLGMAIIGLIGQVALQFFVGEWPLWLWIPGMLVNILWMAGFIHALTRARRSIIIIFLVKAFIISELMASLAWQLFVMLLWRYSLTYFWLEFLFVASIFGAIAALIIALDKNINYQRLINNVSMRASMMFALTGVIIFIISNIGFVLTKTEFHLGNSYSVFFVRTIANISGMSLLYLQQYQLIDQHRRRELDAVQNLFQSQYQQYKAYAENTHYINRKAHDLKHQIAAILAEDDLQVRQEYLATLREAIDTLSHKIETGNGVLDTILTRKNMYCQDHDINFTCIANGSLLHKMEIMDICSLFGNALDNAIEHVETIEAVEKRLVTLKLSNKGKMVILRVDNYCLDETMDLTTLPETSKQDTENHGYGLKNIQYIAKKYNGNMTVDVQDNWFSLCVVFPIV
ncbi:GHKL domain-containing protein [Aerococcaceae bacterium zg-BR22]|uniref:GHKL domain-containing protein n=1 Tax=Aerococcaceae bacterium zg-1292 TaxID=2774330 RepID=UPI0040633AD7|nr:GHKL domain-containing protein [Aerococcaceae bacterium zg-BR22]